MSAPPCAAATSDPACLPWEAPCPMSPWAVSPVQRTATKASMGASPWGRRPGNRRRGSATQPTRARTPGAPSRSRQASPPAGSGCPDGHLPLVRPGAAELAGTADEQRAGLGGDQQLGQRASSQPGPVTLHDLGDIRGLALQEHDRVTVADVDVAHLSVEHADAPPGGARGDRVGLLDWIHETLDDRPLTLRHARPIPH